MLTTSLSKIEISERPLITFAILSYNHEPFIGEAIEGALSQTYSPLEILLSDDCSSDGTFRVINEFCAKYRGPHQIRLNRNTDRMGVIEHVRHVYRTARGKYVVMGAGDDISLPDRVEELYRIINRSRSKSLCIFSAIEVFGNTGPSRLMRSDANISSLDIGRVIRSENPGVYGASAYYDRRLIELFDNISGEIYREDCILPFRALLLNGGIEYIDKVLVRYRKHCSNISSPLIMHENAWVAHRKETLYQRILVKCQYGKDIRSDFVQIPTSLAAHYHRLLKKEIDRLSREYCLFLGKIPDPFKYIFCRDGLWSCLWNGVSPLAIFYALHPAWAGKAWRLKRQLFRRITA